MKMVENKLIHVVMSEALEDIEGKLGQSSVVPWLEMQRRYSKMRR